MRWGNEDCSWDYVAEEQRIGFRGEEGVKVFNWLTCLPGLLSVPRCWRLRYWAELGEGKLEKILKSVGYGVSEERKSSTRAEDETGGAGGK